MMTYNEINSLEGRILLLHKSSRNLRLLATTKLNLVGSVHKDSLINDEEKLHYVIPPTPYHLDCISVDVLDTFMIFQSVMLLTEV